MQSISVKVNFVYKEIRKPVELVNHWYSLAESVRPLFDDAFNFRNTASDIFRYSYISFQKVHGGRHPAGLGVESQGEHGWKAKHVPDHWSVVFCL